jgi:hypothetical protein
LPSGIDRVQRGRQRSFRKWVKDVFAPVSGNCLATDAFWRVVSRMQAYVGDGGDAHVEVRGEGVEDLIGAHMGVGVDDTLAAALHDVGCEGGSGGSGGECALPLVQCWLAVVLLGRDSRGSIDYGGLQAAFVVC